MTDGLAPRSDRRTTPRWLGPVLTFIGFGVLLGVLGPFGSYLGITLPMRVAHYTVNMVVISLMAVAAHWLAARLIFGGPPPLWASLAIALILALPGALVVLGSLWLFAPQVLPHVTFAELCVQTALINVLISVVVRMIRAWRMASSQQAAAAVHISAPQAAAASSAVLALDPLREKLPLPLRRARILALTAEDHYLRVHTDQGAALILMPLSQAIDVMGPDAGLRIHRSHWVARTAVVDSARKDGQIEVKLANGLALPASRSGRRLLEDARLI
jgi:hypothetical protein